MLRPRRIVPVLAILALASPATPHELRAAETTPSEGSDLVLILDASRSMWGQIQGENKIVIARRVLAEVLEKVPDDVNVSLVSYGHRRAASCSDVEVVVPLSRVDRTVLKKKIDGLNPRGKTPIAAALNRVFEEIEKRQRPATVVLMSDGIETCHGDPCQVVRDAKAKGIRFILHVIGFDLGDVDVSQLKCAAQAGGGLYFAAEDAGQFTAALGQAVEMVPASPSGALPVEGTGPR